MKKILLLIAAAVLLTSCAKDVAIPPRAVVVPAVAPKVERVIVQAKETSVQAGKTTQIAKEVKEKYTYSQPEVAHEIAKIEDAARLTEAESKKTEFELEFLKSYAQNVDLKAIELTQESQAKDEVIYKKEAEIRKTENKIIEKDAKISSRNGYLVAAGAIILILGALVVKPWKFFI